jgi:hypothetical protein
MSNEKENPLKNAELSMEQDYNSIDGVINNLPLAIPPSVPAPTEPPLDKVKEQTAKKRRRALER